MRNTNLFLFVCLNKLTIMRKIFLLFTFFVAVSCSKEDEPEEKDDPNLLAEYEEPYVDLSSNEAGIINRLGYPDRTTSSNDFLLGKVLQYNSDTNGIRHVSYTVNGSGSLMWVKVNVFPSEDNVNYIKTKLNTLYGQPEINEDEYKIVHSYYSEAFNVFLLYNKIDPAFAEITYRG